MAKKKGGKTKAAKKLEHCLNAQCCQPGPCRCHCDGCKANTNIELFPEHRAIEGHACADINGIPLD